MINDLLERRLTMESNINESNINLVETDEYGYFYSEYEINHARTTLDVLKILEKAGATDFYLEAETDIGWPDEYFRNINSENYGENYEKALHCSDTITLYFNYKGYEGHVYGAGTNGSKREKPMISLKGETNDVWNVTFD